MAFQACDGDQPWKTEAPGDSLSITPSIITLVAGADAGATGVTQRAVTVYGAAAPATEDGITDNHPAEGMHVDVILDDSCESLMSSPDAGDGGDATDAVPAVDAGDAGDMVDYTQYIRLVANPSNAATAPCAQISDAQIHCVLPTNGAASFVVQGNGLAFYRGPIPLAACSGARFGAGAKIYVGQPIPKDSQLTFLDVQPLSSLLIDCAATQVPTKADAILITRPSEPLCGVWQRRAPTPRSNAQRVRAHVLRALHEVRAAPMTGQAT